MLAEKMSKREQEDMIIETAERQRERESNSKWESEREGRLLIERESNGIFLTEKVKDREGERERETRSTYLAEEV